MIDIYAVSVYTDIRGDPMQKDNVRKCKERYDSENTVQIKMKLNKKTDADILRKLDEVGNKQGYIKDLIRQEISRD